MICLVCCGMFIFLSCNSQKTGIAQGVALKAEDLPQFTEYLSVQSPSDCDPNFTPIIPNTEKECFLGGFLTNQAYTYEARVQLDASEVQFGHPLSGPEQDVPIEGPFVTSHHGVFEVYDQVLVYSTTAEAQNRYERQTTPDPNSDRRIVSSPGFGDESTTFSDTVDAEAQETPPLAHESQFVTYWRRGRVVVTVSVLGAADMTPQDDWNLVSVVDQRVKNELR